MAFSQDILHGVRSLGFCAGVPEMRSHVDAARDIASAEFLFFRRCVGEFAFLVNVDDALLSHPPGFESTTRCLSPRMLSGLTAWAIVGWGWRFFARGRRPSSRRSSSRGWIPPLLQEPLPEVARRDGSRMQMFR